MLLTGGPLPTKSRQAGSVICFGVKYQHANKPVICKVLQGRGQLIESKLEAGFLAGVSKTQKPLKDACLPLNH